MAVDFEQLPHPGIRHLSPYKPGKSIRELANEAGINDIIKLASNENPLGCSPKVKEALSSMKADMISSYPAPFIHPLMNELSQHLKVESDQIIISNGSDLIYNFLLAGFALHNNKYLLTHRYAFSTYEIQAAALGVPVKKVEIRRDWTVEVNKIINACDENTALICLANPNNPTGTLIPEEDILKLLETIPQQTLVVLDEAYFEFSNPLQKYNAIDWLHLFPNLVVTRTFSKAYGLAGLRLGYAAAHPSIISILRRLQLPFTVNQAALVAGCAALKDQDFVQETVKITKEGIQQMSQGLEHLGFDYIPSCCNFITFDCREDGNKIYQELLKKGIIVRPLHPYGMEHFLRVSIGTSQQNNRFLDTLGDIHHGQ